MYAVIGNPSAAGFNSRRYPQITPASSKRRTRSVTAGDDIPNSGISLPDGVYLVFSKLKVGDTVYVEVSDQNKKWQSYAMRMLEANLQMFPEE